MRPAESPKVGMGPPVTGPVRGWACYEGRSRHLLAVVTLMVARPTMATLADGKLFVGGGEWPLA
jgi:hypothetical protein